MNLGFLAPSLENPNFRILSFLGDPNIAMTLADMVSIFLVVRQKQVLNDGEESSKSVFSKLLEAPLSTAGSIILIT